jgi:bifunctional non-homologous end joining protein LigD
MPGPAKVKHRLTQYRAKRDFSHTPEPNEDRGSELAAGSPRFVIQEHHASHLHWDFRLERDGVLVSWAVPKGIPDDPGKNRLAMRVEDHPLSYINFAGEIPQGNYGAGQVYIWDQGTYECHKFRDNEVIITLHGRRVKGKYALFQIAGKKWMMHRMDPPQAPAEPMPEKLVPMLAKLSPLPSDDAQYAYEIKWDGIRAISHIEGGRVRVQSRNLLDITRQYPELRPLGEALGARPAVFDGEIVALDENGRSSFERLQARMGLKSDSAVRRVMKDTPVIYMIFDLLYLDGRNLISLSYVERRKKLEALNLSGPAWQTPGYHRGDGRAMLSASREKNLEGIIAKRLDSQYEPGKRSGAWLKIKNHRRQEFVIGGWTPGERHAIGSLLVGYFDITPQQAAQTGQAQRLIYAGGVGTGFTEATLNKLLTLLNPLRRETSPFSTKPPKPDAIFVEPKLVCEVEFTEWTQTHIMRHPAFKGLRMDKEAAEVVREIP